MKAIARLEPRHDSPRKDHREVPETMTAPEIARAYGKSRSTVEKKSISESWPFKEHKVRGGTQKRFLVLQLPTEIQIAIRRHYAERDHAPAPVIPLLIPKAEVSPSPPGDPTGAVSVAAPLAAHEAFPSALPTSGADGDGLSDRARNLALARFNLLDEYQKAIASAEPGHQKDAKRLFVSNYNSGLVLPALFQALGRVSRPTLDRWRQVCAAAGWKYAALAPKWGKHRHGCTKMTEAEVNALFKVLLHPHRVKVSVAIRGVKHHLKSKGIPSPSSPATMTRAVNRFRKQHNDIWILARHGEKALGDIALPYIERDDSKLEVGDVLVADGKRCNFTVTNPFTGKRIRPLLVGFYDWRSRHLCGFAIGLNENAQVITAALRRAIMTLGKIPKVVYLDNGRAFKSKIFTSDISLEETEIPGMFGLLGISVTFAQPYNAKAKLIEPFFNVLGEQFERFVPSFTGQSIGDKPARLLRNEKMMKKVFTDEKTTITIPQAMLALKEWVARRGVSEHPTVKGSSIGAVFEAGRGPGVNADQLRLLMMASKTVTVRQNGVRFMDSWYYDEFLYGYKGKAVIRYDFEDLDQVMIYDTRGDFLCRAERMEKLHPMAKHLGDPGDVAKIKERQKRKASLKKRTASIVREIIDTGAEADDASINWDVLGRVSPATVDGAKGVIDLGTTEAPAPETPPIPTTYLEEYFLLIDLDRPLTPDEQAKKADLEKQESVRDYIEATNLTPETAHET